MIRLIQFKEHYKKKRGKQYGKQFNSIKQGNIERNGRG